MNKEEVFYGMDEIYYDLEYNVSVDSTDIVGHKFTYGFNWDINKKLNVNLKGSVMGSSASVYKEKEVMAGVKFYF